MGSASERWRYFVTSSLTGWTHTQNTPWLYAIVSMEYDSTKWLCLNGLFEMEWLLEMIGRKDRHATR